MEIIKTLAQFEQTTETGKHIVVFSAEWCGDCIFIKPHLPTIEANFPAWQFSYVDRDDHLALCKDLDIYGIPSFLAFVDGEVVGRFVSKDRKTPPEIEAFIRDLQ
ncbi:MAG: thioredoxin family protein [Turicibacter sp.]|nr:thioredoxin family protein [Turicibacter sp.]